MWWRLALIGLAVAVALFILVPAALTLSVRVDLPASEAAEVSTSAAASAYGTWTIRGVPAVLSIGVVLAGFAAARRVVRRHRS